MLKTLSQTVGIGLPLAALAATAQDGPIPCYPCDDQTWAYTQECIEYYGLGWYYCGDGPWWSDYFWCCPG